jgi:hypothetical protein
MRGTSLQWNDEKLRYPQISTRRRVMPEVNYGKLGNRTCRSIKGEPQKPYLKSV